MAENHKLTVGSAMEMSRMTWIGEIGSFPVVIEDGSIARIIGG
jgi:hypothetical protein